MEMSRERAKGSRPREERSETRMLRQELENLNMMLDTSVDCIKVINCDGTLRKMNRPGCIALGLPENETHFGMKWLSLLPADIRARGRRALKAAREGRNASFSGRSELPGHKTIYWDNILTPVFDDDGAVSAILCVSRNITRQRVAEIKLREASNLDELTRLPNRRSFAREAGARFRSLKRFVNDRIGILIMDVDRFKYVNDIHGHPVGDMLLRRLAERFRKVLEPDEFLARLGGDEFALVVRAGPSDMNLAAIAQRLHAAMSPPVLHNGQSLEVGLSIGGAVSGKGREDVLNLMKASDMALYAAKASGRNCFRMYREDFDLDTISKNLMPQLYAPLAGRIREGALPFARNPAAVLQMLPQVR